MESTLKTPDALVNQKKFPGPIVEPVGEASRKRREKSAFE